MYSNSQATTMLLKMEYCQKSFDFVGFNQCIDLKIFLGKQKHIGISQNNFFWKKKTKMTKKINSEKKFPPKNGLKLQKIRDFMLKMCCFLWHNRQLFCHFRLPKPQNFFDKTLQGIFSEKKIFWRKKQKWQKKVLLEV